MSQQHSTSTSVLGTFIRGKLSSIRRLMTFPRLRWIKASPRQPSAGLGPERGTTALELQTESQRTVIDPLTYLPIELGSYILLLSLHDPKEEIIKRGGTPARTYSTPLRLASVCSRWREIAFGEPQLWTTVALRPAGILSHVTSLNKWLARSGGLPVSIFFNAEDCMVHAEFISRCILSINQVSSRWDAVGLTIPYSLTGLLCSSPARNYLHICSLADKHDPLTLPQPVTLRPTHLTHLDVRPLRNNFLLNQVVRLSIPNHGMDPVFWLFLLKQCPSLEYVSMKVIRSSEDTASRLPKKTQVVLPHLASLGINSSAVLLPQFLRRITTPKLTMISFETLDSSPLPLDALRSLLQRSGSPQLQYIQLECCDANEVDFLDFLGSMPLLESLYITYWAGSPPRAMISDGFFRRLLGSHPPSNDGIFLPNLRHFTYYGRRFFSWELVAAVCDARLRPQPHSQVCLLTAVSILVPSDWSALYTTNMDILMVFMFLRMFEEISSQSGRYLCVDPHTIRQTVENYGVGKLSDSMLSAYLLYLKRHDNILRLAKSLQ